MKTLLPSFASFAAAVGLLILACLLPTPGRAQSANLYDWAWVSRLGPTALPGQNPIVPPAIGGQPEHLAADAAGNVIIAGVYNSTIIFDNPNAPYQTGAGPLGPLRNGYLAKYTPGGALAWSVELSGSGDMGVFDVAVDGVGNVYALGSYTQQLRVDGGIVALASTSSPGFLAKFNLAGVLQWVNTIEPDNPVSNRINLQRMATDAAGNCVVQGNFATRTVFNGTTFDGGSSRGHALMARYTAAGAFVGAFAGYTTAGSAQDHDLTGVGLTPAGEVYLSGWLAPAAAVQFGALPALAGPGTANAAGFVVKFNAANTAEWQLSTTGPARQSPSAAAGQSVDGIAVGPQGRCYAVGGLVGSSMALGTQPLATGNPAAATGRDLFVARIAPNGTIESLVGGGGTSKYWGFGVGPQGEATIATAGGLNWGNVRLPGAPWPSSYASGIVQLDPAGVPQRGWQAGISFYAPALAVDGLNRPVLAGTYGGPSPFTFGTRQRTAPYAWNTLIARTAGVLLAARPTALVAGLDVYPNPARGAVEVRAAAAGPLQLRLLDALGRCVRTQLLGPGQTQLSLAGVAAGSYTLLVQQGEARSYRRVVVAP